MVSVPVEASHWTAIAQTLNVQGSVDVTLQPAARGRIDEVRNGLVGAFHTMFRDEVVETQQEGEGGALVLHYEVVTAI